MRRFIADWLLGAVAQIPFVALFMMNHVRCNFVNAMLYLAGLLSVSAWAVWVMRK